MENQNGNMKLVRRAHEKPPNRLWLKIGIGCIVVVMAILSFFMWSLGSVNSSELQEKEFVIRNGEGAYQVADGLKEAGLIKNATAFKIYLRLFHSQDGIQSGKYKLNTAMSSSSIASDLTTGRGKSYVVITIPEGYTVDRIAALIEEKQLGSAESFKKYAKEMKNPFLSGKVSEDVTYEIEGFLFPDTYHLYLEKPVEEELIAVMLGNFEEKTKEMRSELKEGEMTLEEWVILASLVEREVRKKDEQERVANIFWKRLHIEMPLQSCASIQYILGEPKLELTIADTQIVSPYNTYLHSGFPPGPVSNPGLSALKASLKPEDTVELFFVARSDGSHIFSSTYSEHLLAIERAE